MNIIKAEHLGMCFGVRDAIALARSQASREPVTILGDLVHNESVMEGLRASGIAVETDPRRVKTRRAVITAHGASEKSIAAARAQGLDIVEATCPLVRHAHRALRELVEQGYHPVVIGKRGHVEVRGMTEDLAAFDIIECEADVDHLPKRPRLGVTAQTTQPIERVRALVGRIRERFPGAEVRFADTVCQPTKQRQAAAENLARDCDVVIVIGGRNSNNTRELVQTCARAGSRVYHIQGPEDLSAEWFRGAARVGITAGTSTPDYLIDAVQQRLEEWA
jgi:4-hydroxy-3-methylbut-2-enyl diphosphate reductase